MQILEELKSKGLTYPNIERCLRIPQGTISGWEKRGRIPKDGIALMKMVNVAPWILEFADDDYKNPNKMIIKQAEIIEKDREKNRRRIGF